MATLTHQSTLNNYQSDESDENNNPYCEAYTTKNSDL